jgi:hypothetical protein
VVTTATVPQGSDPYVVIEDEQGGSITLTYNDLWLMLVCQQTFDGDWTRARHVATMVTDARRKRALADRLWSIERRLGGLPKIPPEIVEMYLRHAHEWFNSQSVRPL